MKSRELETQTATLLPADVGEDMYTPKKTSVHQGFFLVRLR